MGLDPSPPPLALSVRQICHAFRRTFVMARTFDRTHDQSCLSFIRAVSNVIRMHMNVNHIFTFMWVTANTYISIHMSHNIYVIAVTHMNKTREPNVIHIHISHSKHIYESYEWTMSQIRTRPLTHINNQACHVHTNALLYMYCQAMSGHVTHIWMGPATQILWVAWGIWMGPATQIFWVAGPRISKITHMHESHDSYEWVVPHMYESRQSRPHASVLSLIWVSHVTLVEEPCYLTEWVMLLIPTRTHDTYIYSTLTFMSCTLRLDIIELYILCWHYWVVNSAFTLMSCTFCVDVDETYSLRWH